MTIGNRLTEKEVEETLEGEKTCDWQVWAQMLMVSAQLVLYVRDGCSPSDGQARLIRIPMVDGPMPFLQRVVGGSPGHIEKGTSYYEILGFMLAYVAMDAANNGGTPF